MILGLKIALRRLHPLCRPYTRTSPTLAAQAAWDDDEKSTLIDLINTKYRGKIKGNWDAVTKHVEQTPAKRYHRWSDDEVRRLEEIVRTEFMGKNRHFVWEEIGGRLGRSANSCYGAYYKYARKPIKAELLDPKLCSKEVEQKAASAIERNRQDADSKGVVAIDWQAVARETGRPMLDILNLLNSLLVWSKSDDAPSAAQARAQMPIPRIHIQQLQYPQEWLPSHVERLQQLLDDNKHEKKDINIQVVSLYMGIDQASCALAFDQFYRKKDSVGIMDIRKPWTAAEKERFMMAVKACGKHIDWKQVSAKVGTRSRQACHTHWYSLGYVKTKSKNIAWTAEEIACTTEMIQNSLPHTHILPTICKMYPDRSHGDLRVLIRRCRNNLNSKQQNKRLRDGLESLDRCVEEMRDADGNVDWGAVAKKVGAAPSMCKSYYERRVVYKKTLSVRWSTAEVDRLKWAIKEHRRMNDQGQHGALRGSIDWRFVAMMVGSRTRIQCQIKYAHLRKTEVVDK
ncbi:hypothetical protein LPJ56_001082 [Coemansia sp. RSA 2599]|nr:hypothetical protein LPJ75_000645 [Coemansia sp. RSA 2598]KAJ1828480.1 hypothetical protein LPJ56_001082 [Coemansia sp. RSA 2599]